MFCIHLPYLTPVESDQEDIFKLLKIEKTVILHFKSDGCVSNTAYSMYGF